MNENITLEEWIKVLLDIKVSIKKLQMKLFWELQDNLPTY